MLMTQAKIDALKEELLSKVMESLAEELKKVYAEISKKIGAIDNNLVQRQGDVAQAVNSGMQRANEILSRDQGFLNTTIDEMQTLLKDVRDQTVASNLKLAEAIDRLAGARPARAVLPKNIKNKKSQ